jgi:hypothetical protein
VGTAIREIMITCDSLQESLSKWLSTLPFIETGGIIFGTGVSHGYPTLP